MSCGAHGSDGTGESEQSSASGKGWIKAFNVSDLQDALICLRYHLQFCRLCRGFRNRLFQQHVQSLLEQGLGQPEMRGNGCGNRNGADCGREFPNTCEPGNIQMLSQ